MPRTRKWTRQEGTQTQATWYRPFDRSMCGGWLLALCSSRGSARRSRIQPDAAADARSVGGTTSPKGKDTKVFSSCLVHRGRGFGARAWESSSALGSDSVPFGSAVSTQKERASRLLGNVAS